MNILIHSHIFPNSYKSASGYFVYYPAQELVKLGHQVTVVSPVPYVPFFINSKFSWYNYKFVKKEINRDGLRILYPRFISIPKNKLYYLRGDFIYYCTKNLYKNLFASEQFDIIHCHVPLPDGYVGLKLRNKYNIPYGVTIHGGNIYKRVRENRLNHLKIKNIIESADFVGIVSEKLRLLVKQNGIYPKDETCRVIHNGINPPTISKDIQWPDADPKSIRLLTVCHTIKRKGIGEVLHALSAIRSKFETLRYYIIGDGVDLQYFKNLAKELGVDDICYFLGAKSNAEAMDYMKACDVFVLPSWNEAFGVVYIEAMYFGKITIGSKGEGIDGLINDGENGFLVEPKNPKELQNKLEYILPRLKNLKYIEENARKTVWPEFSWRNNVQQYLELYTQAIENFYSHQHQTT